jgi:hypothetical protein
LAVVVFLWFGISSGIFGSIGFLPGGGGLSHTGPISFIAKPLASQDTTDIDGAGTIEFYLNTGSKWVLAEPARTFGTNTQTAKEYASGQQLLVNVLSTTANAMDQFTYIFTVPYGSGGSVCAGLANILWSNSDNYWIAEFLGGQEATITLLGTTSTGATWGAAGTDSYTFSTTVNTATGFLYVPIATNYDALFSFYDPVEDGGTWDYCGIMATQNTTAANHGSWITAGGWKQALSPEDYYYILDFASLGGMCVRHDEAGYAAIVIPVTFFCAGDLDVSGTGDTIWTFTLYECQAETNFYNQNFDTDGVTNFAAGATAEQCELTDG